MNTAWRVLEPRLLAVGRGFDAQPHGLDHWRLGDDEQGVTWLILDRRETGANTLGQAVLEELEQALDVIEGQARQGLVIRSGKASGFCFGADVGDFRGVDDGQAVGERIRWAQGLFDRLAALPVPTVAVIHGPCLGGGLELALTCDRRIAVDGASLGFPEVRLGLHPGLGGTFRATRLIDPLQAMTLMLTGKTVPAARARRLGLVDAVTAERHVRNAVRAALAGRLRPSRHRWKGKLLNTRPTRRLLAGRMRHKTAERAPADHYPAPYALIDLWEQHGGDAGAMQSAEIDSFAELVTGRTAQNLVRTFFLREKLKNQAAGASGIRRVHVIGAGTMGGEIAAWCALQGFRVTLADIDNQMLGAAVANAAALYRARRLSGAQARDALDRLVPDPASDGVAGADLIIEAVPEKTDIKRRVYQALEPRLQDGALLATNTSSIPLETLREYLRQPARLLGLHFFNPVAKMQLVEVVSHAQTDRAALERATAFVDEISRLPAPVKSAPGFLVNRALMPYLLEAMLMLDEGVEPETVDRAATRFGMPLGPLELADRVGLDICLDVAGMLGKTLDAPLPEAPARLRDKVEAGELGLKSGRGLYAWRDGKANKRKDAPEPDAAMTDRLVLPMIDTCVACLREAVVADGEVLDGAMIFATGFAPFTGGPLHYARTRGVADIKQTLEDLAGRHGERFAPDRGWDDLERPPDRSPRDRTAPT